MRKCLDCGADNKDVALECADCGSQNLSFIEEDTDGTIKDKKSYFLLITVAIVIVIAVVAGIFGYSYFNRTVPAEPVESALCALIKGECADYIDKLYEPLKSDMQNYLTNTYGSFEAYRDDQKKTLKDAFGNGYIIESKTVDVYDVSDIMTHAIEAELSEAGHETVIDDARYVTVRIVTSGKDGLEDYLYESRYSIEVNGKWYLYESMSSYTDSGTTQQ